MNGSFARAIARLIKRNSATTMTYVVLRDIKSYVQGLMKGSFSQHGEDIFLDQHFKSISNGFYIDIGSSHPFRISNTYSLYRKGWSGVAVDPIPIFKSLFKLWRPRDVFVNKGVAPESGNLLYQELLPSVLSTFDVAYAKKLVTEGRAELLQTYRVEVVSPNTLFEKWVGSQKVDFLSVDVESLDFSILAAIDFDRFRPGLICVEFNSADDRVRLMNLFEANGYSLMTEIGCNLFVGDSKRNSEKSKQSDLVF